MLSPNSQLVLPDHLWKYFLCWQEEHQSIKHNVNIVPIYLFYYYYEIFFSLRLFGGRVYSFANF